MISFPFVQTLEDLLSAVTVGVSESKRDGTSRYINNYSKSG